MRVLHLSRKLARQHPCHIHPQKWLDMIRRYAPDVQQTWRHRDHPDYKFIGDPDLVIVHAVNMTPGVVRRVREAFPRAAVASILWNSLWIGTDSERTVLEALRSSSVVFGKMPVGADVVGWNYREIRPLVDLDTFGPDADPAPIGLHRFPGVTWRAESDGRRVRIFCARGANQKDAYWLPEIREAVKPWGSEVLWVDGTFSPDDMAWALSRADVVVACREDSGTPYTVVEACLRGAIPVVSNHPDVVEPFVTPRGLSGARACHRDPVDIRRAIQEVLELHPEARADEVRQNRRIFGDWTLQAQGPVIVEELRGLVR